MIVTNLDDLCDDVTDRYILMGIAYPDVHAMSSGITAIMSDRGITDCHMYYINASYSAVALIIASNQFPTLMAIIKSIAIDKSYSVNRIDYSIADRVESYVSLYGYGSNVAVARKIVNTDAIVELEIVDDGHGSITVDRDNRNSILQKKEKINKILVRLRILRQIEGLSARHEPYISSTITRIHRGITDDEADEMMCETVARMLSCETLDEMLEESLSGRYDTNIIIRPCQQDNMQNRMIYRQPTSAGIAIDAAKLSKIKDALICLRATECDDGWQHEQYIRDTILKIRSGCVTDTVADNILTVIANKIASTNKPESVATAYT